MPDFNKARMEAIERRSSSCGGAGALVEFRDEALGSRLKTFFDGASGPMPERLMQLATALEAKVERGELALGAKLPRAR